MRPSMIWRTAVHLHLHRNALTVDAAPLSRQPLPYAWLRDACPCTRCVHPSTRQKLFQTGDLKQSAAFRANVREDALHVQWDDGHKSTYPISFLERYMGPRRRAIFHHETKPVYWDAQSARQSPALFLDYVLLNTPDGRLKAYNQLFQYGLLFIRGVPTEITSDAGCELRTLAGHFGELRRTFYGETWDVQSVKGSRNIVYTNLNLGLHMDLLCVFNEHYHYLTDIKLGRYFHHPPRYQILHCLRNRVRGGTSLFVDAFHAAESLSGSDCMTLADIQVPFHYVNDGHHLHHTHPKFEVDRVTYQFPYAFHDETILKHVNYSPPFQAPLDPETPSEF
jgi:gamma-butyrobetaine dioxygenase